MTIATKKPEQRWNAERANKVKGYTKKTLSEGDRERNRVHMSIAKEPHRWRRILYRSTLPASALRVGLALADKYLNRKDGRCDPSHETLAEECDLPVRTVRDGLSALRDLGLITTRKQGLQGTLFFYFSLPCNAAEIQQVDRVSQSGENPSSNVADFRRASGGDPASNLRVTSDSEPSNTVVPSSPLSVVADAPLSGPVSPTHIARKASVEGDVQPSDFHAEEEKKEDAIRAPGNRRAQASEIQLMFPDASESVAAEVAEWWAIYPRTREDIGNRVARARANK